MLNLKTPRQVLLAALAVVILSRALTLDLLDLLDPTESRYAVIAQHMVVSGDWLVPKLPVENRFEPYLGKPPLHFWLTALSLVAFGFEEWSARLPSFLAFLLVGGLMLRLGKSLWGDEPASILPALLTLSSGLLFLYGGASAVDLTLTAAVTLVYVSMAIHVREGQWGLGVFLGLALGFLTKGPVVAMLCVPGLLCWLWQAGGLSELRKLPWLPGLAIAALVTVPWFVLVEIHHPGTLWYFFWNENVARYLLKDYGDRYGSGHRYFYGSSWWMLLAAAVPWSLLFLTRVRSLGDRDLWRNPDLVFAACWFLTPPLFFTAACQLLPAYLLPAVPGFALLITHLVVSITNVVGASYREASRISSIAVGSTLVLCIAILLARSHLSESRSMRGVLHNALLATDDATPDLYLRGRVPSSTVWYLRAQQFELPKRFSLDWLPPEIPPMPNTIIRRDEAGPLRSSDVELNEKWVLRMSVVSPLTIPGRSLRRAGDDASTSRSFLSSHRTSSAPVVRNGKFPEKH